MNFVTESRERYESPMMDIVPIRVVNAILGGSDVPAGGGENTRDEPQPGF